MRALLDRAIESAQKSAVPVPAPHGHKGRDKAVIMPSAPLQVYLNKIKGDSGKGSG